MLRAGFPDASEGTDIRGSIPSLPKVRGHGHRAQFPVFVPDGDRIGIGNGSERHKQRIVVLRGRDGLTEAVNG